MSAQSWQFAVYPGGQPAHGNGPPGRDYQQLWFRLARLPWASLVVVPAGRGTSAAEIATALAEVGTAVGETVTAIVADTVDFGSARAIAQLQPRLTAGSAQRATANVESHPVDPAEPTPSGVHVATAMPPSGRAVISIGPVVEEPIGIAMVQAADAVLLCVEMGKSRLAAARQTLELIGTERLVGAVMIR
jgi:hypothetical protein